MHNILYTVCATCVMLLSGGNTRTREANMKLNRVDADYLGVKEAEIMTGVSRWTWRRWAYDGRVASVKLGSRLLLPRVEVERMITAGTRPAVAVQ